MRAVGGDSRRKWVKPFKKRRRANIGEADDGGKNTSPPAGGVVETSREKTGPPEGKPKRLRAAAARDADRQERERAEQ